MCLLVHVQSSEFIVSRKLTVAKLFGGLFKKCLAQSQTRLSTQNWGSTVHMATSWAILQLLCSPKQKEDINEIINIHVAPTCAPGHSDPSQDLLKQAGRAIVRPRTGGCKGLRAACSSGDPGNAWMRLGIIWLFQRTLDGLAVVNRKNGASAELKWAKLSQVAGRQHRKCVRVLWTKQVKMATIQVGERWKRQWNIEIKWKINSVV